MAKNVVQVSTWVLGLRVERIGQKEVSLKSGESLAIGRGELHYFEEWDESQRVGHQRVSKIMWLGGRSKQPVYTLELKRDQKYRVGPKYAHKVPEPEKEKDPILRTLRRHEVPIGYLHYHSGPVPGGDRYEHDWPDDHGRYALFSELEDSETITEQNRFVVLAYHRYHEGYEYEPDFDFGGGDYYWSITNYSMIEAVYVHPTVDPEMLEQALQRAIAWGKEQEALYPPSGAMYDDENPEEYAVDTDSSIPVEGQEVVAHKAFKNAQAEEMAEIQSEISLADMLDCDACNEQGPKCTSCPASRYEGVYDA